MSSFNSDNSKGREEFLPKKRLPIDPFEAKGTDAFLEKRRLPLPPGNGTPEELKDLEIHLKALTPSQSPELVQNILLLSTARHERLPYPSDPASVRQFGRFVRKAQFSAGIFGGIVGFLFGILLGGLVVFGVMNSSATISSHTLAKNCPTVHVPKVSLRKISPILQYYTSIPDLAQATHGIGFSVEN